MKRMKPGQLKRARHIKRTLGARYAAGYLRKRGWSLEGALWVLLGMAVRDRR